MNHRTLAWPVLGILLLTIMPLPTAAAQSPLPPMGMDVESIPALTNAGAAPRYASFWAGEWMAQHGWGGFDSAMRAAKAAGATPVVYWYYWGDSISPSCVDNGCNGRDQAEWNKLTDELAERLRVTLGGAEVLVVLENEFNKGGITSDSYAPKFDTLLEGVGLKLKGVSGVKLVLGFGAWGENAWTKFPKSAGISEYIGFQTMRAQTRDTEASYRDAATRAAYLTNYIADKFQKPSFLYDVALSSYPDATWERIQAETLDAIFATLVTSGNTGLQGIVYRSLKDTYMDPINYYGAAESHWGLQTKDGTPKPAWNVWLSYANPQPTGPNVPGFFEAESMTPTKGGRKTDASASGGAAWNVWANGEVNTMMRAESAGNYTISVRAMGQSAGGVDALMDIRVGGATLGTFSVPAGSYREFTVQSSLPTSATSLAVVFTNDAIVGSEDRNLIVDRVDVARVAPNAAPQASFAANASGLTASFDASASTDANGDALTYAWHFGDGTTASGVRATRTYAADGTYNVRLVVSDGKASSEATKAVTVARANAAPVAAFDATTSGLAASFDASRSTDADGDALTYAWSFGDGATATGRTATRTYAADGEYAVTLTVHDGRVSSATTSTVRVARANAAPVASFAHTTSGLTASFDASGSSDADGDALSYQWSFGDGSGASGVRATRSYAVEGEYQVTLTVSDGRTSNATTQSVRVVRPNAAPAASFAHTTSGLTASFDASGSSDADGDALTYAWSFGDGTSATGIRATRSFATEGSYTVTLTVSDGRASSQTTATVRVVRPNAAPTAAFTTVSRDLNVSVDASGSSDADGDALTYAWSFGNGATATGRAATHAYAAPGTYDVTLRVSDGRETTTLTKSVTVTQPNRAPVASARVGGSDDTLVFDASGSSDPDGDALSFAWTFSDGARASGARVTRTMPAGTHSATVTVTDARGLSSSATVSASVDPLAATFTPHDGNRYWVQTRVDANRAITAVCASVDDGPCRPLVMRSWGSWAASFYVPHGADVTFRATAANGESATSIAFDWPSGAPALRATFTPYDGNVWWVQSRVQANAAISTVCAIINGGACQTLAWKPWGAWAESLRAPHGSTVVFRATGADGQTVDSAAYRWPVK